jgi:hypothetical protein
MLFLCFREPHGDQVDTTFRVVRVELEEILWINIIRRYTSECSYRQGGEQLAEVTKVDPHLLGAATGAARRDFEELELVDVCFVTVLKKVFIVQMGASGIGVG